MAWGRFCHGPGENDSKGRPLTDEQRDEAVLMSIGNDVVDVESMERNEKEEISSFVAAKDDTGTFYKNQTIDRYQYADSVSRYVPTGDAVFSKDDTPQERERKERKQFEEGDKIREKFEKENSVALREGAKVNIYRNPETGETSYNIYDSREIVHQAINGYQTKAGKLYKDTSTNMRTADGYVVMMGSPEEAEKEREKAGEPRDFRKDVRSTHNNATRAEMEEKVDHFVDTHRKELADKNNHLCVWYDKENKRMYMAIATWHKTESEAKQAGNARLNSSIADCSTGAAVPRHPQIIAAEKKYEEVRRKTKSKAMDLKEGEFLVGSASKGGVQVINGKMIDTNTGEVLTSSMVQRRAREERDATRNFLNQGNQTTTRGR